MALWTKDPQRWVTPPLPPEHLERLRLHLRKTAPKAGLGAHLHRRKGQAMEFREHRAYSFGDDVRKVDWAASARHGKETDLLVREFEAEERRTAVLLIDMRPAMRLPEDLPKALVAAWVAQCLAAIALQEGDRVDIVPLFHAAERVLSVRRPADLGALRRLLLRHLITAPSDTAWEAQPVPGPALGTVRLPPASVIVLISDMLWAEDSGVLVPVLRKAQASYRSVHIVELDSWPHERALLQAGPFRLQSLENRAFPAAMMDAPQSLVAETEAALTSHRRHLHHILQAGTLVWPDKALQYPAQFGPRDAARRWFAGAFERSDAVASLVSRSQ